MGYKHINLETIDPSKFWSRVNVGEPDACWPWMRVTGREGYGQIKVWDRGAGKKLDYLSHRVAWAIANQAQPDGFVCHHCDNPPCVNPAHLWLGTPRDNVRDMMAKGRHSWPRKTHCVHGHEYTADNTYRLGDGRRCRACIHLRNAARKMRERA